MAGKADGLEIITPLEVGDFAVGQGLRQRQEVAADGQQDCDEYENDDDSQCHCY